ncbi:hypothetical protein Tco_1175215 [Tanacetum coccineum]
MAITQSHSLKLLQPIGGGRILKDKSSFGKNIAFTLSGSHKHVGELLELPPLNVGFPEFYKELEAEILGEGEKIMGIQFIQLELRLGKNPSRSFREALKTA